MPKGRNVLVVALLGVALSGCGETVGGPVDDPGPAEIVGSWTSCAEAAPQAGAEIPAPPADTGSPAPPASARNGPEIGRIDKAFTPASAVLCGREIRPRPGGGQEQVATERHADEIDALVEALRLPDQQRPRGEFACTLDMIVPPWLALLDERGRWLRPYLPTDSCGKPRVEVRTALAGLRLTTVDTRTVGSVESPEAAAAGCAQHWADMVWVETTDGRRPGPPVPPAAPTDGPLRLCVYQVPPSEQGGGKPAGDFVYGGPLPRERQAGVLRALGNRRAVVDCATPASRFAVLRPLDGTGGPDRYVELDGCRRFLVVSPTGGSGLGQGDSTLAGLLGPL
ncbi:hypothetical protein [Micromonospora sp. NPDC093244]|uniref:hypothetical protein n=1 Tax=Micromonospora sp. NPDC093244 TaxID=3155071 RepID=UPI00341BB2FC